jgi:hypothetical protein
VVGIDPRLTSVSSEVSVLFLRSGVTQLAGALQEIQEPATNVQEFTQRTQVQRDKLSQQKRLGGGPRESRTPDQRFRKYFGPNSLTY